MYILHVKGCVFKSSQLEKGIFFYSLKLVWGGGSRNSWMACWQYIDWPLLAMQALCREILISGVDLRYCLPS